ncbi:hypothetical protein BDI4_1080080 [Burkholderia diffusa]|uniref:hypothetical protein n=1 Tax=Burkholderia diffusa TaxID=488732 RepID=UPI001CB0CE19|nr:hypothetical protein [Burkholderia diffusa]CAG9241893.1 hypothetical protein BDI4_1080080 [Burkholderia diffusa]
MLDEDRRAFDLYFRPSWDLRSITGGQALDAVWSFLSEFLNVPHWNLPTDNAGVERVLRRAVSNGDPVPIVNHFDRLFRGELVAEAVPGFGANVGH